MQDFAKQKIILATARFGELSEVWMYRQATRMRLADVHVVCQQHLNKTVFPADGCVVHELPSGLASPVRGARLGISRLVSQVREHPTGTTEHLKVREKRSIGGK